MKAFCQSPSGLPKAGLVCASTTASAIRGLFASNCWTIMPPIECPTRTGLIAPTCGRKSCKASASAAIADGRQWRRPAIARHVPGDGAKALPEIFQLAAPRPRRAADAVQEYQRRQIRIAGGLIGEAAILRCHRRKIGHAGPPVMSDPPMLTGPPAMKSDNFIFKAIVADRTLRLLRLPQPGSPARKPENVHRRRHQAA